VAWLSTPAPKPNQTYFVRRRGERRRSPRTRPRYMATFRSTFSSRFIKCVCPSTTFYLINPHPSLIDVVTIQKISYDKSTGAEGWITSDGRAYFVHLNDLSSSTAPLPNDASMSEVHIPVPPNTDEVNLYTSHIISSSFSYFRSLQLPHPPQPPLLRVGPERAFIPLPQPPLVRGTETRPQYQ
jgi:hypothetical protein